eukprot:scaffold76887_cov45-Attheya_sp.AAC.1
MSTDLRISSTLRKTARVGKLTDTDTDPGSVSVSVDSKGGLKGQSYPAKICAHGRTSAHL